MVRKAFRRRAIATALLLCGLYRGVAFAQEPDPKQAAKQHFDAGNAALARGEVAGALVEFQRSRALFPTRGNTLNAAIALQRLGRFDEALELYASLPRDFELDREQRERVDREIELLRGLTGTLTIRAEPGVSISIDGRERGSAPFSAPLIVLGGAHTLRARQAGRASSERRIEVVTGAEQELTIDALPPEASEPMAGAPSPPPPIAPAPPPLPAPPSVATPAPTPPPSAPVLGLTLDVGPALGVSFGGPLADSCTDRCNSSLPLGFAPRGRGSFAIAPRIELGLELSFSRLAAAYHARPDTLEPRGSGKQPGTSRDELTWSAWSLGAYAGWTGPGRLHARALLGLGLSFARLRDERAGTFDVSPEVGDDYTATVSVAQSVRAKAFYVAPEAGLGWNVAPHIELSFGVTLMSSILLSTPRFSREGVVVQNAMNEPELAYLPEAELSGGVIFALLPRLGVGAHF